MPDLLYQLTSGDEISAVNGAWISSAPSQMLGRPLWDFIADKETRHIYRLLHHRVRTTGAPVRIMFRCDTPSLRRLLELEISAGAAQGLTYRVRSVEEQTRAPAPLLDPRLPRGEAFVTICSWCKRVAAPPLGWLEVEQAVAELSLFAEPKLPQLTHGVCEECARRLNDTIGGEGAEVILATL